MADFDSFNYDIESRLPEWWKGFGALEPINKYTQNLIAEILQGLLTTMGVVQPLNCWLTIPEEYTWYHHYKPTDEYLVDENGNKIITNKAINTLFKSNKIYAQIPNTKRDCDAKIKLKLLGRDVSNKKNDEGVIVSSLKERKNIDLSIQNENQTIFLKDIPSTSTIEISTKTGEILIDGVANDNLIEGSIKKIKPVIKHKDYKTDEVYNKITFYTRNKNKYIDFDYGAVKKIKEIENFFQIKISDTKSTKENLDGIYYVSNEIDLNNNIFKLYTEKDSNIVETDKYVSIKEDKIEIDLKDENKKTEIVLNSSETVDFDLQIYLYKPTYTTEQNIRIATVSAFPLEWVRLYGYFCHPFNNKAGYEYLWGKEYTKNSRTTFDRITKQFDCERFYIQVKFQGIGTPLLKGFPQANNESNAAFQPNPNLDKWGKIYGLPRRSYRPNITKEEEPFTFPKYYPYPIEQDYWYEERMVNEYRYDDDAVNALFIKDNDFNNIGMLECIYPFMNNIWVYTETINPNDNKQREYKNIKTDEIKEDLDSPGVKWNDVQKFPLIITLNPQSNDIIKLNDNSYESKKIKCSFDLSEADIEIPKNIIIKGLEVELKTNTSVQSQTIKLGRDSNVIIPYISNKEKNNMEFVLEKINIIHDEEIWLDKKGYYTIGGENNLFGEEQISREQLFNGNNKKLDFEFIFINENNFLESTLYIEDIRLNIYYEVINPQYNVEVFFDKKEINLMENEEHSVKMKINLTNTGKVKVYDKEVFIVIPPELQIENGYNGYNFNLKVGEVCPIDDIVIKPTETLNGIQTGWFDILVFCEDKVISNEILIRGKEE